MTLVSNHFSRRGLCPGAMYQANCRRSGASPGGLARRWALSLAAALLLAGCASSAEREALSETAPPQVPTVQSSRPAPVSTPYDVPMMCLADRLSEQGRGPLKVAVGHLRDYTGRFSEQDGGAPVTQGASLLAISALGKLGDAVHVLERFDIDINDKEQEFEQRRKLGSERPQHAQGEAVRWRLFEPGRVMQSDAFLVGGITEINYNITSGGAQARLNGIGPRARTFTLNVALDLRLVETQTLRVIDTVSLQKQMVGYEVGLDAFRFFGDTLVDISAGARNQEALNLGVRAVLELGLIELIASVTEVEPAECLRRNSMYRRMPTEEAG